MCNTHTTYFYKNILLCPFTVVHMCICLEVTTWDWIAYQGVHPMDKADSPSLSDHSSSSWNFMRFPVCASISTVVNIFCCIVYTSISLKFLGLFSLTCTGDHYLTAAIACIVIFCLLQPFCPLFSDVS